MGTVIRLPQRHARASSDFKSERASTVIPATPSSDARRDNDVQCRDGMPRKRQQLTAAFFSDKAEATALVPPRASMTESGVNMEVIIVCDLQTSQEFAFRKTTFGTGCGAIYPMSDPREVVFGRLDELRIELSKTYPEFKVENKFAANVGIDKSTYSLLKSFERDLPMRAAFRIKEKWSVSLDWLYYGEQPAAGQLMAKIGKGKAAENGITARKRKKA